jgi:hypothetical protein
MVYCLFVLLCMMTCTASTTNEVTANVNNTTFDQINVHMKDNYNLPIKKNGELILTGYTIQDSLSHLVKTYSVLHIDF